MLKILKMLKLLELFNVNNFNKQAEARSLTNLTIPCLIG